MQDQPRGATTTAKGGGRFMRAFYALIWIIPLFKREFGASDFEGNYSRLYTWVANQLGHVSLGLIVALGFVWAAKTITLFIDVNFAEAPDPLLETMLAPFTGQWSEFTEWLNGSLLSFTMVVGLILYIVLVVEVVKRQWRNAGDFGVYVARGQTWRRQHAEWSRQEAQNQERSDDPIYAKRAQGGQRPEPARFGFAVGSAVLVIVFVLLVFFSAVVLTHLGAMSVVSLVTSFSGAAEWLRRDGASELVGYIAAGAYVALIILALSRNIRVAVTGLLATFLAVVIASSNIVVARAQLGGTRSITIPPPQQPQVEENAPLQELLSTVFSWIFSLVDAIAAPFMRAADGMAGLDPTQTMVAASSAAVAGLIFLSQRYVIATRDNPWLAFGAETVARVVWASVAAGASLVIVLVFTQEVTEAAAACPPIDGARDPSTECVPAFAIPALVFGTLLAFVVIAFAITITPLPLSRTEELATRESEMRDEFALVAAFVASIITFVAAIYVARGGLHPSWSPPFGAFIAALAVWWTKEFGNDVPNSDHYMREACAFRFVNGHYGDTTSDESACAKVYEDLEAELRHEVRWDARADALFYFAGAWIAAGVLTEAPVLTPIDGPEISAATGAWTVGAELIGVMMFAVIFIARGRLYAYRQSAIDWIKAQRSERLINCRSRIALYTPVRTDGAIAFDAAAKIQRHDPLTWLNEFCCEPTGMHEYSQLVVVGAPGSGKAPLGVAIATEAALADLRPGFVRELKFFEELDCRTARLTTLNRLITKQRAERVFDEQLAIEIDRADLVVVDDADLARFKEPEEKREMLRNALITLSVADRGETDRSAAAARRDRTPERLVWLLDAPSRTPSDGDQFPTDQEIETARQFVAVLQSVLESGAPGSLEGGDFRIDPEKREHLGSIAVVFVSRHAELAEMAATSAGSEAVA